MKLYTANCIQDQFNYLYPNCIEINTLNELLSAVGHDHVAPRMKDNHRNKDNFIEADCVQMDLDNTHSSNPDDWKSIDDVTDAFPDVRFYYVRSRNYMLPKDKANKDGSVTHYEPREKFHFYFPTERTFQNHEEYKLLMLKIAGMFPYFDLGACKPAQMFYGVSGAKGGEVSGSITIDDFISTVSPEEIKESIEAFAENARNGDYESPGDEAKKAVSTLSSNLGIAIQFDNNQVPPVNDQAVTVYSEEGLEIARAEQQRSFEWLQCWAMEYDVPLGSIYRINTREHQEGICICVSCPWEADHTSSTGEKESVIIIDLGGKINYLCRHNHCLSHNWKEYRAFHESRKKVCEPIREEQTQTKEQAVLASMQMFSADQLASEHFEPIFYPVDGIIPTGLSLVASPPKTGKSWMALDMAIQITTGQPFLSFPTNKCGVIYFALEDCDVFAQERLNKVLAGRVPPENLHIILNGVKTMDDGFFQQLDALLNVYPDVRVVIIDTLGLIAGAIRRGESSYAYDYRVGSSLKKYADAKNIAVVCITHTTKLKHSEDFLMNISGTNGTSGSADCTIVLDKEKRTDKNAIFFVCGRRVRQASHEIIFDDQQCRWLYRQAMSADDKEAMKEREAERLYMESDIREAVIQVARHNQSWCGSSGELRIEASKYGVGIVCDNKSIGLFLSQEIGRFLKRDRIHVWKIKNGTGPNKYRISEWKPSEEDLSKELDSLTIDGEEGLSMVKV